MTAEQLTETLLLTVSRSSGGGLVLQHERFDSDFYFLGIMLALKRFLLILIFSSAVEWVALYL